MRRLKPNADVFNSSRLELVLISIEFGACKMRRLNQALLHSVIGLKPKPITFSRAWRRLLVLASSFDWFTGLSVRDYSRLGFTTLIWKLLWK